MARRSDHGVSDCSRQLEIIFFNFDRHPWHQVVFDAEGRLKAQHLMPDKLVAFYAQALTAFRLRLGKDEAHLSLTQCLSSVLEEYAITGATLEDNADRDAKIVSSIGAAVGEVSSGVDDAEAGMEGTYDRTPSATGIQENGADTHWPIKRLKFGEHLFEKMRDAQLEGSGRLPVLFGILQPVARSPSPLPSMGEVVRDAQVQGAASVREERDPQTCRLIALVWYLVHADCRRFIFSKPNFRSYCLARVGARPRSDLGLRSQIRPQRLHSKPFSCLRDDGVALWLSHAQKHALVSSNTVPFGTELWRCTSRS